MINQRFILLVTTTLLSIFLFSCGGAEVKVKNNSSFSIKEITIGNLSFSDILYSGQESSYKEIEEGSYKPKFYAYSVYLGVWVGYQSVDELKIEEGGFLSGDEQYTWTLSDSTIVTTL